MDNNLFQRLKELIDANQNFGIVVSANPTFDQMAAALGLYLSLKQMNKNASVVCPTDIPVELSSLVGIDKVQKTFGGVGGDLVVSFPYKEGEIEKVSYDVDGGKLRIVVKAGAQGLSFNQSDVNFQQGGAAPSVLFFIGVADAGSAKQEGVTMVNIDNKSNNTKYGDIVHVDSKFTSLSEEIADFLTLLEPQIELDVDSSQNLLSGILSATNDFQNGQGSYLAFEMAGILMKKGAVRSASGAVARPTATAMPSQSYFPPLAQEPVREAQSVFQPSVPAQATPNFGNIFNTQSAAPVEPAPVAPEQVQSEQPIQSASAAQSSAQPPVDWLTPKVYKGSTVV